GRGIAVGSTAGEHVGGGHLLLVPGLEEAGEYAALLLPGGLLVIIQGDVDLRPGRKGPGRPGGGFIGLVFRYMLEWTFVLLSVIPQVVNTSNSTPHFRSREVSSPSSRGMSISGRGARGRAGRWADFSALRSAIGWKYSSSSSSS